MCRPHRGPSIRVPGSSHARPPFQAFWHLARKGNGASQVEGLKRLSLVSGIGRLYVHAADTKRPVELMRYVRGLAPEEYRLVGSGPVRLVVAFPRPRLSVLSRETEAERGQRWVKALTELAVRRAVLRLATGEIGTVQVTEVADQGAPPGFDRFVSAAVAGSGQSAREVEQAQAWRREEMERVAGGGEPEPPAKGLPRVIGTPPKRMAPAKAGSRAEGANSNQGGALPAPLGAGRARSEAIAEDGSLA